MFDVILTELLQITAGQAKNANIYKEEWFTSYLILRCILSSHHGLVLRPLLARTHFICFSSLS